MYEIERKFYLPQAPDFLPDLEVVLIRQGYLAIEHEGPEVRVRQKGKAYWLTAKSSGGIQRIEQEIPLASDHFESLWLLTEGRRLEKKRYIYPFASYEIEIDEYLGVLQGLYTAEVEFASIEDAESFQKPDWLYKEVTAIPSFQNRYLAQLDHYQDIIANI